MPSHRVPLYIHISGLCTGLLMLFALINLSYQFIQSKFYTTEEARLRFQGAGQLTLKELDRLYGAAKLSAELVAQQHLMSAITLDERLDSVPFLATILNDLPAVNYIYMGYDTGDFFMLLRGGESSTLVGKFPLPVGAEWIIQSIHTNKGKRVVEYLYLNSELSIIKRRVTSSYEYDPRARAWYREAKALRNVFVTSPYAFFESPDVGVSFTRTTHNGLGVAGLDVSLRSIERLLLSSKITPGSHLVMTNSNNEVISSEQGARMITASDGQSRLARVDEIGLSMIQELVKNVRFQKNINLSISSNGEDWQGMRVLLPLPNKESLSLWMATPNRELMAGAIGARNRGISISLIFLMFAIVGAFIISRKMSKPLTALTLDARKMEEFDFEASAQVTSSIVEVGDLAHAMGRMRSTIQHFLELSKAISSETNFQKLLARLLIEMQGSTGAHGGMIYLADAGVKQLQLVRICWGSELQEQPTDDVIDLVKNPTHPLALALSVQNSKPELFSTESLAQYFGFMRGIKYPLTLWVLPLKDPNGVLLGLLVLLIDERERQLTQPLMAFAAALSSTAAIALNTQRLLEEQKKMLESFIQLIAGAIDSKSPYTGGHCQRVPELTKMLAQAACSEKEGPFKEFSLNDEQWEALHIAAWLHDCGKITTPEYVVDKATKLETIYDRIHEVRMRFEVLKRDAELAYWRDIAAGADAELLQKRLSSALDDLDDDFAFVAQCNVGGELMAPEHIERIKKIAERTWLRTLSDRIGISQEEQSRKHLLVEAKLPILELLLVDRPDHLFQHHDPHALCDEGLYGFNVKVPEYLYNRGEVYNLCIARGTLTEEERYKINEHIIQTITMLEKLPFPRHLQSVPEIAGGHHEKMNGKGYPRGLTRDQMSWPARMMGIADIFEALTAIDRPYKKGKKLSAAIAIMAHMKATQHIDPDIFELFLRSGIYLAYANLYMPAELIDMVDIQLYLD